LERVLRDDDVKQDELLEMRKTWQRDQVTELAAVEHEHAECRHEAVQNVWRHLVAVDPQAGDTELLEAIERLGAELAGDLRQEAVDRADVKGEVAGW
jgi:hypothetical protein